MENFDPDSPLLHKADIVDFLYQNFPQLIIPRHSRLAELRQLAKDGLQASKKKKTVHSRQKPRHCSASPPSKRQTSTQGWSVVAKPVPKKTTRGRSPAAEPPTKRITQGWSPEAEPVPKKSTRGQSPAAEPPTRRITRGWSPEAEPVPKKSTRGRSPAAEPLPKKPTQAQAPTAKNVPKKPTQAWFTAATPVPKKITQERSPKPIIKKTGPKQSPAASPLPKLIPGCTKLNQTRSASCFPPPKSKRARTQSVLQEPSPVCQYVESESASSEQPDDQSELTSLESISLESESLELESLESNSLESESVLSVSPPRETHQAPSHLHSSKSAQKTNCKSNNSRTCASRRVSFSESHPSSETRRNTVLNASSTLQPFHYNNNYFSDDHGEDSHDEEHTAHRKYESNSRQKSDKTLHSSQPPQEDRNNTGPRFDMTPDSFRQLDRKILRKALSAPLNNSLPRSKVSSVCSHTSQQSSGERTLKNSKSRGIKTSFHESQSSRKGSTGGQSSRQGHSGEDPLRAADPILGYGYKMESTSGESCFDESYESQDLANLEGGGPEVPLYSVDGLPKLSQIFQPPDNNSRRFARYRINQYQQNQENLAATAT